MRKLLIIAAFATTGATFAIFAAEPLHQSMHPSCYKDRQVFVVNGIMIAGCGTVRWMERQEFVRGTFFLGLFSGASVGFFASEWALFRRLTIGKFMMLIGLFSICFGILTRL